jgi:hypothetical protein
MVHCTYVFDTAKQFFINQGDAFIARSSIVLLSFFPQVCLLRALLQSTAIAIKETYNIKTNTRKHFKGTSSRRQQLHRAAAHQHVDAPAEAH